MTGAIADLHRTRTDSYPLLFSLLLFPSQLQKYDIPVPKFIAAHSAEEAYKAAQSFGGKEMVIKAQVLAGGRGKGHFEGGLKGGVHLIKT